MGVTEEHTSPRRRDSPVWLRTLELLAVGEPPVQNKPRATPARAPRTSLTQVDVGRDGVRWRTRRRHGWIDAREIARVAMIEVVLHAGSDVVMHYAVVLDHGGSAILRVSMSGANAGVPGVRNRHALRDAWAPLEVPVARETCFAGRVKDYRRRWPEAFGLLHAHPFVIPVSVVVGWLLGAIVLGR